MKKLLIIFFVAIIDTISFSPKVLAEGDEKIYISQPWFGLTDSYREICDDTYIQGYLKYEQNEEAIKERRGSSDHRW